MFSAHGRQFLMVNGGSSAKSTEPFIWPDWRLMQVVRNGESIVDKKWPVPSFVGSLSKVEM